MRRSEGGQPILTRGKMLMRRFALVCTLLSAAVSLAQQAPEWRPNIGEDNKAATWEATLTFLKSSLPLSSVACDGGCFRKPSVSVQSESPCSLSVKTERF